VDINGLKDFEALVAQKNFSRAAEERNVSQPAFSRRIRALEDEVGVSLINRQTLPLSLTPAGEVFLSQARIMLRAYHETIERCRTIDAARENVIRFATSQSLYMTHYQTHIAPLVEKCELDVDLNSTSWAADHFVSALQQSYCDVILTYWHPSMDFLSPLDVANFDHVTLLRDAFIPVSKAKAPGKPLFSLMSGGKKPVPLLSYGAVSALRSTQDYVLRQHLLKPKVLVVNQNALAISVKAMIMEGFGMGWLPRRLCAAELSEGTMALAGDDSFQVDLEVRLYCDPRRSKTSLASFWQQLKALSVTEACPQS
jgi:DNA-binding transcriptional LysR family regulator